MTLPWDPCTYIEIHVPVFDHIYLYLTITLGKSNLYKALDISAIQGAPYAMLEKYNKWIPKYYGNNIITIKEHIGKFQEAMEEHEVVDDHEDVVMNICVFSLEDARMWFRNLDDTSVKTWNDFRGLFLEPWDV